MLLLSIDIGSTWTKGASFRLGDDGALQLANRVQRPTTVDNLSDGFFAVNDALNPDAVPSRLYYSSSAKGGLNVAALGLVPDITSEMANIAAQSAGAKLGRVFSYKLTRDDIRTLQDDTPDILLFAGGTDGGNEDFVRANAEALAGADLDCAIVYAGNRAARDTVEDLLGSQDLTLVDNLLPTLDEPNPEPARAAIREIFLNKIVHGKGLSRIVNATGVDPVPTPYAMYEYCTRLRDFAPGWDDFMLIDIGGATTDVYSNHAETLRPGTVRRGLPEPVLKRTVEGDLGLRVSAAAAATQVIGGPQEFQDYIRAITGQTDSLPETAETRQFDAWLAGACAAQACARHAGRTHQVATADGLVDVQTGRDLTAVRKVIGTGGYLAHGAGFSPLSHLAGQDVDDKGRRILTPASAAYYRDDQYLFPLLANVARDYPQAAARAGIALLQTDLDAVA